MTTQGMEDIEAANNDMHWDNADKPATAETQDPKVNIEIGEKDVGKVDVEKIQEAARLAEEIDTVMKDAGDKLTPENISLLAERLAEFVVAVRESMLFWPVTTAWKLTPNFLKKTGAGKGIAGFLLNKTPGVTQILTNMTQGMLETGLLDSPEGLDPAAFSKNTIILIKALKWAIPLIGIVQPEVLALEPFMPALEKIATGKGELMQEIRDRVAEKLKPVETEQVVVHEETAHTDPIAVKSLKKAA